MNPRPSRAAAVLEVILGTVIWGFGFVTTKEAIPSLGPMWMTVLRFALATALIAPFALRSRVLRRGLSAQQARLALAPGLLVAALLLLQTTGLKYTTVTNSGFITTLYVVIVPLLGAVQPKPYRRAVSPALGALVAVALLGTALMCKWERFEWNLGDGLTLAAAFCAAVHILLIERRVDRIESALAFNTLQSAWAGLAALPLALAFEPWTGWAAAFEGHGIFAVVYLATLSTFVGFALQLRAQRVLPAAFIALLFLLESPFAAFFGFTILGERLLPSQWAGAALILVAAGGACVLQRSPR